MSKILKKRWVQQGRKVYRCWWCEHYILEGIPHLYMVAVIDEWDGFTTMRECMKCVEIQNK